MKTFDTSGNVSLTSDGIEGATATAFKFNTSSTYSTDGANLLRLSNNNTNVFDFSWQGGIDHVNSGATTAAHSQSLNLNWVGTATQTSRGQYSVVMGANNDALGTHSIAVGSANQATGNYCGAFGESNQVNAPHSFIVGMQGKTDNRITFCIGGNAFANAGDCQVLTAALKAATTNATQTTMLAQSTNYVIPADTTWAFSALVVARSDEADGNLSAVWRLEGCLARDESSSTVIVGSVTKTVIADGAAAAWDITATADDTNEALAIQVTGEAATNIRWVAKVDISQVTYA